MGEAVPQSSIDVNYVAELVVVKLTRENHLVWKAVFIPVLKSYNLFNIIEGTEQNCPSKDNTCRILITKTLSKDTLPYITKCERSSARDLWIYLGKVFGETAKSYVRQLRTRMQTLEYFIFYNPWDYIQPASAIADKLAAAGYPISNTKLVSYLIDGLPWHHQRNITRIRKRNGDNMSLQELAYLIEWNNGACVAKGSVAIVCLWFMICLYKSKGK